MITTLLVSGAVEIAPQALHFATDLIGSPPDQVLALPADLAGTAEQLSRSDLVVVACALTDGALDDDLRRLLPLLAAGSQLSGVVAFAVTIGDRPLAANVVNAQLRPALLAAGATCLAPGLHVTSSREASYRAMTTFAAYWRPVIGALVGIGRTGRVRVA